MDWIVNSEEEDFQNILFQHGGRNWEITLDRFLSTNEIDTFVSTRTSELVEEYVERGSYNFSDLIVDWTTKNEI